ncbi:hypothetical protein B0J11DRAFT_532528 [Dendryphion nanum]|uniref:Uncharacterized protein n=1 Tax=Dendryphion nanum TaxID=256645 RepID=A0A9P9III3_9PLEO|nr:hypothetical protein B0J11DRAFT_532528 [Dendryphion nanum]
MAGFGGGEKLFVRLCFCWCFCWCFCFCWLVLLLAQTHTDKKKDAEVHGRRQLIIRSRLAFFLFGPEPSCSLYDEHFEASGDRVQKASGRTLKTVKTVRDTSLCLWLDAGASLHCCITALLTPCDGRSHGLVEWS